ncbi:hypothetical protein GOA59_18365 [Sinorhizobium meliloti]|nr:hypothetical protein [Sinorhizobium meliloti]MDW9607073.1 hypothetical protein [Sinorhizobium meliloti]MDW9674778.1 hypothetical protein [Sinorhizobium meliloti]MDW9953588.1 hypothetical protein [Sinorhizobium meliloti]MDX0388364.1 hypothetical protein [Sinorhizobium meliloti]
MGSFEALIAPIADDHLRAKGAVRHEPCARLVARMFTFWAKKIAYCIVRKLGRDEPPALAWGFLSSLA